MRKLLTIGYVRPYEILRDTKDRDIAASKRTTGMIHGWRQKG